MIKIVNSKKSHKFLFLLVMVSLFTLASCSDDEEEMSVETEIISFGPAGVKHGEDIIVVGTNLNAVSAILFKPSVEVTEFKEHTSNRMVVTVPQDAEPGGLIFKTPNQEIETKTIINFEVPVVITSVTESVKPGEDMTITGDKLNWIESITFPGDIGVLAESFVSQSAKELVVTVPMETESGRITFRTGGTEPLVFASENLVNVISPTITALNPTSTRHESTLKIEGANLDLVIEVVLYEGVSISKSSFVSQSASAIEVTVPKEAKTGKVTLKQVSPVETESVEDLVIILPIGTSISPENQVPGVDEVTITGTDLDLVASMEIPGSGTLLAADFKSQSAEQIVFDLPESAAIGVVDYTTIHGVTGSLGVVIRIAVTGPGLGTLLVPFYEDAVADILGQGGGFGDVATDFANTEVVRDGSAAIKVTYTGQYAGGAQFGTWGKDVISTAGSEVFALSIFGTTGTEGKLLRINLKNRVGTVDNDNVVTVTIKEGEWTDFQIPLADFGGHDNVSELFFQNEDWTGAIYIDHMGLDVERSIGLDPLTIFAFDDATSDLFGAGGGWGGGSSDFANTEIVRDGVAAIKVTYAGGFGGQPQFGTWGKSNVSLAGMNTFAFSVFGTDGTGGNEIQVSLATGPDPGSDANVAEYRVTIKAGEWTDFEIPLTDIGSFSDVAQIRFQDTDWSGVVYIDHIGFK